MTKKYDSASYNYCLLYYVHFIAFSFSVRLFIIYMKYV